MNDITPRKLKTGGDPRTLPDYAALRDELSKLTHPARPDINWRYVEKRCLSLFEQNGVELQTAAWYTLARTQLAGLFGLTEGMAILEALISHQWETLWPQPVHARMEILSHLSQRLQQLMRMLPLNDNDLSQLYRAEQLLTALGAVLQRLELKHLSQLETLRALMHNSAVRLENSHDSSGASQRDITLPVTAMNNAGASTGAGQPPEANSAPDSTVKWVYVAQPEHQANVEVLTAIPTSVKPWKSFTAGMCTMLAIGAATVWGWHVLHRPDPLQAQLAASLAPLPATLTRAQLTVAAQYSPLSQTVITQTQQQLARLDKLPPDWNIDLSSQLVEQVQTLWPEKAKPLVQQWQQQLNANALPAENLNGWHQGMTKLQQLSDRLSRLDEQKGKYMTVSELKSEVFATMQAFNQAVPAEEPLRALSMTPGGQSFPAATKIQFEVHLKQLIARYALMKQAGTQDPLIQQSKQGE